MRDIGEMVGEAARREREAPQRRAALVRDAFSQLADCTTYEHTIDAVGRLALELGELALVHLVDASGRIRQASSVHRNASRSEATALLGRALIEADDGCPIARVIRTSRAELGTDRHAIVGAVRDASVLDALALLDPRAFIVTPLRARGRVLGSLMVATSSAEPAYCQSDLECLCDVGAMAALAIDGAQLQREADDAVRMKDEFLSTLSHELRTPLNAVLGWTRLLLRGGASEAVRQRALESIDRNGAIQARLVDDLLDASRIIAGKLHLDVGPMHMGPAIEAAVSALSSAAEGKNISIDARLDPAAGPVRGDPDRMQQIVWNLLSNAIKFTAPGGRVEVRLERSGDVARLSISDTGEGIAPAFKPFLFDRFRQADGTVTRKHSGIGMGLAIVRHLVELHGGTVDAESAGVGRGATLVVSFPITHDVRRSVPPPGIELDRRAAAASLARVRILLVDDEPDARELATEMLQQAGAEVRASGSSYEAFELARMWCPDVLVADIGLPDEDGYALMQKIRALSSEGIARIPAVALTAYARVEDRVRALEAGFQVHVPKPVDPADLVAAVSSLVADGGRRTRT